MAGIIFMTPIQIVLLAASLVAGPAMAGEVAVIVNKANDNVIDKNLVMKVYSGESKSWSNGGAIAVYDLPDDNPTRAAFASEVMGKSLGNMKSLWAQNVFAGKAVPPKVVASDDEIKKTVAANKGAIGYVKASAVDDTVKVIVK